MECSLRNRFIKCLNIPFLSVTHMFWDNEPEFLADCLEDADTFLFSADKIWGIAQEFISKNPYLEEGIRNKINNCLFEILGNRLEWTDEEKWQDVLDEITGFIFSESFYGDKTGTRSTSYMSCVCEDYLIWYKDVVLPMKNRNNILLDYLQEEFDKNRGLTATKYFIMFITIAGFQQTDTGDVSKRLLDVYCEFVDRVPKEDMLVSQISWSFWQSDAWYILFHSLVDYSDMLEQFLKALPLERYGRVVDGLEGSSPILSIGKTALIHLYMTGNLLFALKDELSHKKKERIEKFFLDYFWGIQKEKCNPFDVESIRLLESELVVKRCFECMALFDKKREQVWVSRLLKETPEKLSFFIRYIDKESIRKQIRERLSQDTAENFTKNICFIPTEQKLIENMLQMCFCDQEDKALLSKVESVFHELQQVIHKKGKHLEKEYSDWMEATQCRIDILNGQEEKVLQSGPAFYQAYIYLNRNDMDSLIKAEQIYGDLFVEQRSSEAYINQYAACVRICTSPECTEDKKEEYLAKAKIIEDGIEGKCELSMEGKKILYENRFFLYMSLDDMPEIMETYAALPHELRYEYDCAKYIVKMFARNGDMERADEYLGGLSERYGDSEELIHLKEEVKEIGNSKVVLERPTDIVNVDYSIESLQNALLRIKSLQDMDCAKLRLMNSVLPATHEAHLLYMVLDVARQMEQYSSLLKYGGKISDENSYNKMFQILFNQRNQEVYGFYAMDQSQEGTAAGTLKNGRESVGSPDNMIYHGQIPVSIMEGLILRGCDKASIELHIRKIEGYNSMHVQNAFILIYADTDNPMELWNAYKEVIQDISYYGQWEMFELVDKDKIEKEILNHDVLKSNCRYICMTRHRCKSTGDEVHKYHILLDFRKDANVKEAKAARKK